MVATPESPHPPKLLEQVVARLRVKHYSLRTEQIYVDWIKRFVWFHGKRHPKDMGAAEIETFLSNLAVERAVSASTQNQAKSALLFLYKEVLQIELPWLENVTQAKVPKRLPVVMTQNAVRPKNRSGRIRHVCHHVIPVGWNIAFLQNKFGLRHEVFSREVVLFRQRVVNLAQVKSISQR